MKRNKLCPYKGHCNNDCYDEFPCDFAVVFDKLQRKIDRLKNQNSILKAENERLCDRIDIILHPNF